MKSVTQANLKDKRILVACDLDVPVQNGVITDEFRLNHSLKTLKYIINKQGYPIIMGKMGRPNGEFIKELSTEILRPFFTKHLEQNTFALLENLQFDNREKLNDDNFAKELAGIGDVYVNEAFSLCHRENASIVGVPKYLPSYAGFNLQNEITVLKNLLNNPKKPFIAIVGGAKVETKRPVINRLLTLCDHVLVGGKIGLDWKDEIPQNLHLPVDYAQQNKDIGPKTIQKFKEVISSAATIVFNGPLGLFEETEFENGTKEIIETLMNSNAHKVIGGGDTISAVNKFGKLSKINHISTGGGAMLKFIENRTLPGIEALETSQTE